MRSRPFGYWHLPRVVPGGLFARGHLLLNRPMILHSEASEAGPPHSCVAADDPRPRQVEEGTCPRERDVCRSIAMVHDRRSLAQDREPGRRSPVLGPGRSSH
jgi:hypothetical protein